MSFLMKQAGMVGELSSSIRRNYEQIGERLERYEVTLRNAISQMEATEKRSSTELTVLKSQLNHLIAKQDQIVLKQDQIQCTLQSDNLTPSISSPTTISWPKIMSCSAAASQHGAVTCTTPVYSLPATSYTDVSSGLGDLDLDTLFEGWDIVLPSTPQGDSHMASDREPPTDSADIRSYKQPVDGNSQAISSAATVSYQQHRDGNPIAAESLSCQQQVGESHSAAKRHKPSSLFTGRFSSSAQPKSVDPFASSSGTLEGNSVQVALSRQSVDGHRPAAAIPAALGSASLESDIRRAREVVRSHTDCHTVEKMGKLVIYLAHEVFFTEEILRASTVWGKRNYRPLDIDRLNAIITVMHEIAFANVPPADFNTKYRPRIISILSSLCRRLR